MSRYDYLDFPTKVKESLELRDKYVALNPFENAFELAKKYASNDENASIFNIFLEVNQVFLLPDRRVLVALVNNLPGTQILPCPDFYGPALKMELETKDDINCSTIEIYLHNTCEKNVGGRPNYELLQSPLYRNIIGYLGISQIPVYNPADHKLIAVGIRAKEDFDLEGFYTRLFHQCFSCDLDIQETLQIFDEYKNWISKVYENQEMRRSLKK